MRVLVVNGSPHADQGTTGEVVDALIERWRSRGHAIDLDTIVCSSAGLGPACSGCLSCMTDGEQTCPLVDVAGPIERLMMAADVVVFATPIHSFQISAPMKRLIDQFAYMIHRPRMFNGTAVLVTTAAGAGHEGALDYLESAVRRWGFTVAGRLGVNGPALTQDAYRTKVDAALDAIATDAMAMSRRTTPPAPSLNDLIGFKVVRLLVQRTADTSPADQTYWSQRGWFDADYFVPAKVPWWRRFVADRVESKIRKAIDSGGGSPVR